MNVDSIASIISFVPLRNLRSVLISSSILSDISLSQYPFGVHSKRTNELKISAGDGRIPTIYKIFGQKAFKLLKNPNISQYHLFVNAIHDGKTELVKEMLKNKRMDISKQYTFDALCAYKKSQLFRPLSHALSKNRTEIVKLLLKDDRVDPNTIELYWHPSINAINKGHIDSLKALIEDPRVNFIYQGCFVGKDPDLAMIMAIESRYYSIVKLLVDDDRVRVNTRISGYVLNSLIIWFGYMDIVDKPDSEIENDLKIVLLLIKQPGFDFSYKDRIMEIVDKHTFPDKDRIIEILNKH